MEDSGEPLIITSVVQVIIVLPWFKSNFSRPLILFVILFPLILLGDSLVSVNSRVFGEAQFLCEASKLQKVIYIQNILWGSNQWYLGQNKNSQKDESSEPCRTFKMERLKAIINFPKMFHLRCFTGYYYASINVSIERLHMSSFFPPKFDQKFIQGSSKYLR